MSLENVQPVSGTDDQILNQHEEQEILQAAARQGLRPEAARDALAQVCTRQDVVVESQVRERIRQVIETLAENPGGLTNTEFAAAVALCRKEFQGRRDEAACRRMVIDIIDAHRYPVRQGLFNHWYDKVKKEVAPA